MARIRPIPDQDVPVLYPNGTMTLEWYTYFQSRERVGLSDLPDVRLAALANGDSPVWSAADQRWENQPN